VWIGGAGFLFSTADDFCILGISLVALFMERRWRIGSLVVVGLSKVILGGRAKSVGIVQFGVVVSCRMISYLCDGKCALSVAFL